VFVDEEKGTPSLAAVLFTLSEAKDAGRQPEAERRLVVEA
jgi:hypothetical protein